MRSPIAMVTLRPAEATSNGYRTLFARASKQNARTIIDFNTLEDLGKRVTDFANAFGEGCEAFISLPRNQEPPDGFDRFRKEYRYFNIPAYEGERT